MTSWTAQEEEGLVGYLVDAIEGNASGRSSLECHQNHPRDVYFVGNLRSRAEIRALGSLPSELINKLSPVAIGLEVQIDELQQDAVAEITASWCVYYRAFPTHEQQRKHQAAGADAGGEEQGEQSERAAEDGDADEANDANQAQSRRAQRRRAAALSARDKLAMRYKKLCGRARVEIGIADLPESGAIDLSALRDAINLEIERLRKVVQDDPETIRRPPRGATNFEVPADSLRSDETFRAWQGTFGQPIVPNWAITVSAKWWREESEASAAVVAIELVNDSGPVDDALVDPYVFEPAIRVAISKAKLVPFRVELAPKGFRFDPYLWARGHNCEGLLLEDGAVESRHVPVVSQSRYVTRSTPKARFEDLASDPVPTLDGIEKAMRNYLSAWEEQRHAYQKAGWTTAHANEFDRDHAAFKAEIERFNEGAKIIASDPDALLAFKLTNETFRRLGHDPNPSKAKESWRLFQIVFIVSQVPGILALKTPSPTGARERESVDVIYFPTGGGKTEAYLGTIVFHAFFDRLRGKTAGVTCWIRFPLRLLTLQQTQRMADAIGVAELVRLEQRDGRLSRSDGFCVGYLVGQEGTPNELTPPGPNDPPSVHWSEASDALVRQKWKRVAKCPSCRTNSIEIDFDASGARLIHRCTNRGCKYPRGEVPVVITDNEVFRYLPTVVIGTVDKLAAIGNQRKFALVLGQVDGRCQVHGYFKGICCQKDCKDKALLKPGIPAGLSGPTLLVQDELHLLKEGLGTFDSHYETFLQAVLQALGSPTAKIIASSATIEQFERQVEHLYGKSRTLARIFPGPGPTLRSSFYAETLPQAQRVFIGLLPHNKTLFNAVLELIELYHRELIDLRRHKGPNPWGGQLSPGTTQWLELIDFYWVTLNYFLANKDVASIHNDLEGDTNPKLHADGLPQLAISQLLGATSTDDVTTTLELLERPAANTDAPRTVLATSMVSHGVDIDRLNAMLFYGMPRLTAEYIQASSRVGRSHVGLVIVCLHPARERDQSHFAYFRKYHEYLGQLVEPVAINRWATYSIDRTIPGLFMAVLLQRLAHRAGLKTPNLVYMLDHVKKEISSGTITAQDFIPLLESAYLVPGETGDAGRQAFRPKVKQRVQQFLDHILQTSTSEKFVSGALIPSPMRSLRDVEEAITIELDTEGSDWARLQ